MYHPQNWSQPFPVSREITVTGNGEIDAQPDYVQIQIEGTKFSDIGKMLLAVCDYKRINKTIPRFDVRMELSGGRITMG